MKTIDKLFLILAAVLIAAGVAVGLTLGWDYAPGAYSYTDMEYTADASAECSFVSVQMDELNVNVYATPDKTISLAVTGAKTADRVSVVQENGVLRITEKKAGFLARLVASDDASVVLRIPAKFLGTVDIAAQSSDIYIDSLVNTETTVRAASKSGDISTYDLHTGVLELTTVSGGIYVDANRGLSVTASTTSGYVSVTDVKGTDVSLSSVSGRISLRNAAVTGTVTVNSTSGDIELDDVAAELVTGDTTSGDLEFDELDTNGLVFSTTSGDISGDLLHLSEFAAEISTVSGDVSGIKNRAEGTRTLKLQTTSGDIDLDD